MDIMTKITGPGRMLYVGIINRLLLTTLFSITYLIKQQHLLIFLENYIPHNDQQYYEQFNLVTISTSGRVPHLAD